MPPPPGLGVAAIGASATERASALAEGAAPDFELRDVSGVAYRLGDLRGRKAALVSPRLRPPRRRPRRTPGRPRPRAYRENALAEPNFYDVMHGTGIPGFTPDAAATEAATA